MSNVNDCEDQFTNHGIYKDALSKLNQGIAILDGEQKILLWNSFMEGITGLLQEDAVGRNIYEVLPRLDKSYLRQAVSGVLKSGYKYFFSAAIHGNILDSDEKLNLKISLLKEKDSRYLLFEFINVTDEFVRVNELKRDINELHHLNSELKKKERIIKSLAYYDVLTGIGNRTLFYLLAEKLLSKARQKHEILSFMFIDVDHFKCINDTYGHVAGDKVIIKVAQMLKNASRKTDIVTRYGGDEFVILLPRIRHLEELHSIIRNIKTYSDRTICLDSDPVVISLSIGASMYPFDGDNLDQLISKADTAMYIDKRKSIARLETDTKLDILPYGMNLL